MEQSYNNTIKQLRSFINHTNRNNEKDCKRTKNYLEWLKLKTSIIESEDDFIISDEKNKLIQRGNVLWVNFGFNIGSEFGGQHPAVIIKKNGKRRICYSVR